jgi:hypothetical protein
MFLVKAGIARHARSTALAAVASLGMAGLSVIVAPAAHAACSAPGGSVAYVISAPTLVYQKTNLQSQSVTNNGALPAPIGFNTTTTSQVSGSITGTLTTGASALFASASASIGITVGGSKSWDQQWTYQMAVPVGKRAYMQQRHKAYSYKWSYNQWNSGRCSYSGPAVSSGTAISPLSRNLNSDYDWTLVYF